MNVFDNYVKKAKVIWNDQKDVHFATMKGESKQSVKWGNLTKFVVAFLNFWTDVLFTVLVYEEYLTKKDDFLVILCICSATVVLSSWIDQLTLCYRFCNYWLRETTWGYCPKINASYVEARYLQHHGNLRDYLKRSESKLRVLTAVSPHKIQRCTSKIVVVVWL